MNHKYELELPDGDTRKAKVWWTERETNDGALIHKLSISVDETPSTIQAAPTKELTEEQLLWIARSHGINVPEGSLLGFYRDLMSTTHIGNVDSVCTSQERVKKTAKSEQVPLTEGYIKELSEEIWGAEMDYQHLCEIQFARAIEKAHGIEGKV